MRRVPFHFDVVQVHRQDEREIAVCGWRNVGQRDGDFQDGPGRDRRGARPSRHPVRRLRPPVPEQSAEASEILADRESNPLRVEEFQGELEPLAEEVHERPIAVQAEVQAPPIEPELHERQERRTPLRLVHGARGVAPF